VHGASGGAGPKLREGDRQVPEGIHRVEALNPDRELANYPSA
jgi:murein L,D-transpeptidase YafK